LILIHGAFGLPEEVKEKYLLSAFSHQRAMLRLEERMDEIWKKEQAMK
jgi:hypothetical protein